jgi:hypothetical protein
VAQNYVPILIDAGFIPLLKDVLEQGSKSTSTSSLRAAMTCLRVITNDSLGTRAVMEQPDLCQAIVAASTRVLDNWCANNDQLATATSGSLRFGGSTPNAAAEIADTLHLLANLVASGTYIALSNASIDLQCKLRQHYSTSRSCYYVTNAVCACVFSIT